MKFPFLFVVGILWSLPSLAQPLTLKSGDTIAYIGNNLADRAQHFGHLEAMMQARHPDLQLRFRNLGFTGDTLTKRPRSNNFGSPEDWLKRAKADVVFAFFGYNEAFAGEGGVKGFKNDLKKLIEETRARNYSGRGNARIVLFSPVPHEKLNNPHLPDGAANNANLELYTRAMQDVAEAEQVPFVDLFTPLAAAKPSAPLTINGIHLNADGYQRVARIATTTLFGETKVDPSRLAKLREAVLEKNHYWFNLYRTVDGYNVYGGRSKLNWNNISNADVMREEMNSFEQMTSNRDPKIWARAQGRELAVSDDNLPQLLDVPTNRGNMKPVYLGGKEAIGKMDIGEGLAVNLFASEEMFPELINPVQMAVDTDSRLFVVTWPSYPHWNPHEPARDKIVILPDEDGDGVADTMIPFAEGLNSVTGIEFWGGGLLVAAAPEIWFLKDTDGDDRADVKIRMLQGVSSADTHHTANGLTIGPDGGLYWSRGVFHVTNSETPTRTYRSTSSGVYRFDPRTFELDFWFPIGPNPHGLSFDGYGYQFATDGTSGTGNYVAVGRGQRIPSKQLYRKRVRPVPAHGILSSSHFPERNNENFLICNSIGFLGVLQHKFVYDGADIQVEEIEPILVSKDPNFRPTDVEIGGDGALYVSDWANAIIGHMQHNMRDPLRDHEHGRVYRVTAKGRDLLKPPKMKGRPMAEVMAYFRAPEKDTRYRARLELSGRDSDAACAAAASFAKTLDVKKPVDALALLQCLWVHEEARKPNLEIAAKLQQAAEARVRAAAVRTVGHWGDPNVAGPRPQALGLDEQAALALLLQAARDPAALVRSEAVLAASFYEDPGAAEVLFEVATRPTDVQLDQIIQYARKTIDPLWKQALKDGRKLSPTGQRFVLKSASVQDLLRMERSEAVNRELLARPGVDAAERSKALVGLAASSGQSEVALLIGLIREAAGDENAPLDEYAALLPGQDPKQLQKAGRTLQEFALAKKQPALQRAGIAASVNAGSPVEVLWDKAREDAQSLQAFLDAVPAMEQEKRRVLYDGIRSLAFELPQHLRKTPPPGASVSSLPGVRFEHFQPRSFSADLKVMKAWKPTLSGNLKEFSHRVPQGRVDGYALKLSAVLNVPTSGTWSFAITSDDGSRLYIDGKEVINNDGNHGMVRKEGRLTLGEGGHAIVVTYFDSGGGDGLQVQWSGPGVKWQNIPAKFLGGSAGSSGLERSAAVALEHVAAAQSVLLSDMVALLGKGKHGDLAVKRLLAAPGEIPESTMSYLGKALARWIPQTPIELRDSPQFKDSLKLGELVAGRLSSPLEREDLREAMSNLDLAVIHIRTVVEQMRYDRPHFTVKAGKAVKIIFENPDALPHNLIVALPGSMEAIAKAAEKLGAEGFDVGYIPKSEQARILHHTRLLNEGEKQELSFIAPAKPGVYDVVCSFPGHWMLMNGSMTVVD